MPRFALLDNDDDHSDSDSNHSSEENHLLQLAYHDDDDPVGIASPLSYGQSRYHFDEDEDDNDLVKLWSKEPPIGERTHQTLLQATHNVRTETVPMNTLVKYAVQDASKQQQQPLLQLTNTAANAPVDPLIESFQALSLITQQQQQQQQPPSSPPPLLQANLPAVYLQLPETEQTVQHEMTKYHHHFMAKTEQHTRDIAQLLQKEQRQTEARVAQQRKEAAAAALQRAQEQQAKDEAAAAAEAARVAAEEAARAKRDEVARMERERKAKELEAKKYLLRAEKYVKDLGPLQASVAPFDKSKPMAQRRLAMKKIVNGKVNTLNEDASKIRSVAADVAAAIAQAKEDDKHIAEHVEAGNRDYTSDMARGKRYFVDLLCKKVIVRVQAEGFNGQRGDGFPLAHMLALVSKEHKDIVPLLAAHVYTVCPTAIPRLPTPGKDASEEELMLSLGMIKDKDGNYETFERFLTRTEGIISLVANIMASEPVDHDHKLFGGPDGAVKWLMRFLNDLPSPPVSPLPLITAPVLDAFLTGAGHMMARKFPEEFQEYLNKIESTVMQRLDEGAIGKPSATRLRKTMEGGFQAFKDTLPSRAIGELYHGSSETGVRRPSSSAPAVTNKEKDNKQGQSQQSNPFGGNANPNPFGGGAAPAPSPFGGGGAAPAPSPFGGGTPAPAPSPFGGGSQAPAPSPFGGGAQAPSPSPFEGGTQAPAPSPFGGGTPAPSPFGSGPASQSDAMVSDDAAGGSSAMTGFAPAAASPFGSTPAAATPSPFGGAAPAPTPFGAAAPSPSPFGAAAPSPSPFGAAAPSPSPFGAPAPAPATPFGASTPAPATPFGGAAPAPATPFGGASPFGSPAPAPFGASPFGAAPATNPSPFGAPAAANPSPFGGAPAPNPSPFGGGAPAPSPFGAAAPAPFGGGAAFGSNTQDNRQPCRFFAQGRCRYGDQCKYSHTNAGGGGGSDWGGPRR